MKKLTFKVKLQAYEYNVLREDGSWRIGNPGLKSELMSHFMVGRGNLKTLHNTYYTDSSTGNIFCQQRSIKCRFHGHEFCIIHKPPRVVFILWQNVSLVLKSSGCSVSRVKAQWLNFLRVRKSIFHGRTLAGTWCRRLCHIFRDLSILIVCYKNGS